MKTKSEWRQEIWTKLQQAGVSHDPFNRIPDFRGADQAADRLADQGIWRQAGVVMVVPDAPQAPVRQRALEDGKLLYMAVPKLAGPKPFCRLTLEDVTDAGLTPAEAAPHRQVTELGTLITPDEMEPVDLIVLGSVVVNHQGVRIGKGAGYADRELAMVHEHGLVQEHTMIVTTVHGLQVVDEVMPEEQHDYRIELAVTPVER